MAETFFLGDGVEISADSALTQLNNNILMVGASGSGKTMSYAEMRLLNTTETSMILTLSKRRLVRKYRRLFEERGYKVYSLDLTAPLESTVSYDPMAYIRSTADITYLARSIVMADPNKAENRDGDPFWDNAAQSLLSALIAYIMHVRSKPSFADVVDLFTSLKIQSNGESIETNLDRIFERLADEDPQSFAWRCWKTFRFSPMRTASCIYAALSTTIDTVFNPELLALMRKESTIRFEDIADSRSIFFVTTSAVNPSLDIFAGIFYSQAVKMLFEYAESLPTGELPYPVHLLCDDFAVGSQIPDFANCISIFREKKISVSILLQSESQLVSMYGESDAKTIINNCDRYIYMGGMDLETSKNIAERIGKPVTEVLYMPIGSEIVFQRGQQPVVTTRYPITKDPLYQKLTAEYGC